MDYELLQRIENLEDEKLFLEEAVFFESFDKQFKMQKRIEQIEREIERLSQNLDNFSDI